MSAYPRAASGKNRTRDRAGGPQGRPNLGGDGGTARRAAKTLAPAGARKILGYWVQFYVAERASGAIYEGKLPFFSCLRRRITPD